MFAVVVALFGALASLVFWLFVLWLLNQFERSWSLSPGPNWDVYGPQRRIALARDGYRCRLCGRAASITHHIQPRRYGGADAAENLMTVCAKCHPKVEPP